jgi:hypothetical protein
MIWITTRPKQTSTGQEDRNDETGEKFYAGMIAELEKRNGNIIASNDMKQSRTSSIPGRKKS